MRKDSSTGQRLRDSIINVSAWGLQFEKVIRVNFEPIVPEKFPDSFFKHKNSNVNESLGLLLEEQKENNDSETRNNTADVSQNHGINTSLFKMSVNKQHGKE